MTNATDRATDESVMAMLKHDREIDAFEVAPLKKALGGTNGPLPADLAKVLEHAVPPANVNVAGFPVKRTRWDPERTVLAFVREPCRAARC